jgi:hypothetical protein
MKKAFVCQADFGHKYGYRCRSFSFVRFIRAPNNARPLWLDRFSF